MFEPKVLAPILWKQLLQPFPQILIFIFYIIIQVLTYRVIVYCLPHSHILSFTNYSFQLSSTSVLYFASLPPRPHLRPFPLTSGVLLYLPHFYSYPTFPMSTLSYPPPINHPEVRSHLITHLPKLLSGSSLPINFSS